ncbi:hypothetical protein LCGC14_2821800, partial [marine sediment metagenome]
MGIFSRPKLGLKEAGIGLVSRSSDFFGKDIDEEDQNIELQQKYLNAYNNFPIVSGSVDMVAEQAVQDYYFEGPNSDKLTKWAEVVNLPQKLLTIAKHMKIGGNIWAEIPNTKELKLIDPRTMKTWRKNTGDIIGHSQSIGFLDKVIWGSTGDPNKDKHFIKRSKLKEIVHFKYNCLASDKYGNGDIHSTIPLLETKDQIEADLKIIIRRYAAPIIHVKVGDEMHLPTDDDLSATRTKVQDIYADTEYVHSYLVKSKVLGFQGKLVDTSPLFMHIDNNIEVGMQTPLDLFYGKGEGGKGADTKSRNYGRHIKHIQRILKANIEDQIVSRMTGNRENK